MPALTSAGDHQQVAADDDEQATTAPKKRLVAVVWLAVTGSKKPAKFRPICRPDPQLAGQPPPRREHQPHRGTQRHADEQLLQHQLKASHESSGSTGGGGSEATGQRDQRGQRRCARGAGTTRVPSTGSADSSASARKRAREQRRDPAQDLGSVKLITARRRRPRRRANRHPTRPDGLRALQVLTSVLIIHGPATGQHRHGGDHLGHEGQSRLADLRGGLEDADHRADHTSTVSRIGRPSAASVRPSWPKVKTCWEFIGEPQLALEPLRAAGRGSCGEGRGERAEQQVPAVGQHEQHQLEGQGHEHRLSIIMPRLISTLATIMSMTRKG